MKIKDEKYKEVTELPQEAQTIAEYANNNNISIGHVYTNYYRGKAHYDIVKFKTILFVVDYISNDTPIVDSFLVSKKKGGRK